MRILSVCVGSSCHLKGSYEIINELKRLIAENGLDEKIELKACFCLEHCQTGVNIKLDGSFYTGMTIERLPQFFKENLL